MTFVACVPGLSCAVTLGVRVSGRLFGISCSVGYVMVLCSGWRSGINGLICVVVRSPELGGFESVHVVVRSPELGGLESVHVVVRSPELGGLESVHDAGSSVLVLSRDTLS